MSQVQFDETKIAKLTTRQMHEFYANNRRGYFDKLAGTIAQVAVSCPEEWGAADDEKSYSSRPYRLDFKPVIKEFSSLVNEADKTEIPDLKFNLDAILASEMSEFFKSVNTNNLEAVAEVLTRVVASCPSKWGKPDAKDTYLERPYSQFLGVVNRFIREVNSDSGE